MVVEYSNHLKLRLRIRKLPDALPKIVFEFAPSRYHDRVTGVDVAVMKLTVNGRVRTMAVSFVLRRGRALLITVHPLKANQLQNRIHSGRWQSIREED